jgi:glycerate dehydrogenase
MSSQSPNIVVLDGFALNPGDLSWERLQALGKCDIRDRTPIEETVERAQDAEIILTNKAVISRETIEALPRLRYIGVTATGYNIVDVEAAREREIPVTNVPIYGTGSVAQMVFSHLLNLTQHTSEHASAVNEGRWTSAIDWCFWDFPLVELEGLTMGIIGLGRIGRATAKLADAFGMKVIAASRSNTDVPDFIETVDMETLFSRSDVISLHCPLTPETQELVNAERLSLMKPSPQLLYSGGTPLVFTCSRVFPESIADWI